MVWQLQDAKNKFSKVVDSTIQDGPQVITRHGKKTVVVISISDYRRFIQKKDLKKLLTTPLWLGEELDVTRDKSLGREVDLTDL